MPWDIYGPHGEIGPQGPRGLNWVNAGWVTATPYKVDDALTHGGVSYRCYVDHTSGATDEPGVGVSWATVWKVLATSGVADLDSLTDVDLTTTPPADGDTMVFDSGAGMWVPGAPAGGGGGMLTPVVTSADVNRASFTALDATANDSELLFSVVNTKRYRWTIDLWYAGPNPSDLKMAFGSPTYARGWFGAIGGASAMTTSMMFDGNWKAEQTLANPIILGTSAGGWDHALIHGYIDPTADGTVVFRWAQNSSSASSTTRYAGCTLLVWEV